ncbi:MAG: hypothetical protein IKA78_03680, partial [Oscillospiraceae bacterium]|nr:hypothetical protein [Oscillospiraceae bacterium]
MGLERLSQFPKKRPFPKPAFLFSCKKKRVLDAQKKKRQQSFGAAVLLILADKPSPLMLAGLAASMG